MNRLNAYSKMLAAILGGMGVIANVYAEGRVSLFVQNSTRAGYESCSSTARYTFLGYEGSVHSRGSEYCPDMQFYSLEGNVKYKFNLNYYEYFDSYLEADASCKDMIILSAPNRTMTLYIEGRPSNNLTSRSHIVCFLKEGVPA